MKKEIYYKLCRGENTPYTVKKSKGYRAEYVAENGESVVVFFEKEDGNGWTVTEESTGLSACGGFPTMAKAEEKITAEFVESMQRAVKRNKAYIDILEREKEKLIEESEKKL